MPHDINDLKAWLHSAQKKGARYLIICHDGFEMGDYPVYVLSTDNFWDKIKTRHGEQPFASIQSTTHEVYDLEMDIDAQLKEVRAWHPPVKIAP